MLETVEIKNFQGHEHTILEFDKGVNVIKGPTHSGKSSIWRALRWALQNRPLGEGFVSYFAGKNDETSVALEFNDGVLIRSRHKLDNIYEVNGTKLKAVKFDIPEEVKELSQLNEVNLHDQDDPYFLILDSPGSVARKLNEAVGLDIIDESMKKVNSIVSKTNMKLSVINEEMIQVGDELESMLWLDKAAPLMDRLDESVRKRSTILYQYNILQTLVTNIRKSENRVKAQAQWLEVEQPYLTLRSKIEEHKHLTTSKDRLTELIHNVNGLRGGIAGLNLKIKLEEAYIKLSHKVTQRKQLASKVRQLKQLCKRMQDSKIIVNSANKHVTNLQSLYDITLKSTGTCPLCGKVW